MIIIDLLKIGINFILSDSKLIRSKSINLIEVSVSNYLKYHQHETRDEPSSLCPNNPLGMAKYDFSFKRFCN